MASKGNYAKQFITNVKEVIQNKIGQHKATFVFNPQRSYYLLDGQEITEQRLESIYPTEIKKITVKGQGLDSRSNWMQ